jgi:hypothetical protein
MPRSLILAALFVSSACAAIWPERLGEYDRKAASPYNTSADDRWRLWDEDGIVDAESANYGPFRVMAWRFKDATGAYAASLSPGGERVGNYMVNCEGKCPKNFAELADAGLPHVSHGSLPLLGAYFPAENLLPKSERYILGPAGLNASAPEVPAQAALFDFGTEAQFARYRTPGGTVALVIFSFATPSLARQQLPQFQKISGSSAKRTGPLIAVAIGPSAASAKLLDTVNYQGIVAENEKPPEKPLELKPESAGQMVLAILSLAGLLLLFCLLSGLAVGGSLRLARRFGYSAAEGSTITLHLEGK